jgi:hypothetical protein
LGACLPPPFLSATSWVEPHLGQCTSDASIK